eukprot:EG_transcript_11490
MLACTLAGLAFAGLLQKMKGSTLTPPQTNIGSIHQHAMFATAGEFQLPALPWERGALAPFISAETIDYHYGKHHQAYVTKLNELLGLPENVQFRGKTLEELVLATTGPMFNQAAQIWNHTFYWNGLRPNPEGRPNPAGGAVAALIERDFGSFAAFQEQFTAACVGHFGSGWVWLVYGADGRLRITQGHDAANPVRDGTGTPLLTCDVWEHAYYIDQRNARPAYVKAWWSLVNWDFVNGNLPAAVALMATSGAKAAVAAPPAVPPTMAMFATAGEFQLPALPWERGALAPFISAETIDYHYGKHHQAYVTKLNELLGLPENAQFRGKTLEELVLATTGPMFNQAAQIWNHTFYW